MPSDYTTRERFLNRKTTYCDSWNFNGPHTRFATVTNGWQSTTSRMNAFRSSDLSQSDVGGDFKTMKFTDDRDTYNMVLHCGFQWDGAFAYNYAGEFQCIGDSPSEASLRSTLAELSMSQASLQTTGTRFIAEASPSAPKAGLSTSLVELKREGLPGLSSKVVDGLSRTGPWKRRIKAPVKGSGSDYLNWQFGWVPVISDVQALAKAAIEADQILRQLYKDEGKVVRRKRGNPDFTRVLDHTTTEQQSTGWPGMVTNAYASPSGGKLFSTTETTRSLWFSGAFQYHIPDEIGSFGKLQGVLNDAHFLYGLSASPLAVWNLIPFSWLADWAVNTGDVLSNISDQLFSRQVLRYGYVMARTERITYWRGTYPLSVGGMVAIPRATQTYVVKQRMQATPFGFGLTWDGFTPYQFSILAALGISRGR